MKISSKKTVLVVSMLLAACVATIFQPTTLLADAHPRNLMETEVPKIMGPWRTLSTAPAAAVLDPTQQTVLRYLYTETLSSTYSNANKQMVMLSLAYGKDQSDGREVHKPDICYPAQGFTILEEKNFPLKINSERTINVRYLKTQKGARVEPLIYWTTAGDYIYQGKLQKKIIGFNYSGSNLIPDGLIARVSTFEPDTDKAIALLTQYIRDWYASTPEKNQARYFGTAN